jgi:hypothetical protein
MKKIVLVFGTIAGCITAGWVLLFLSLVHNNDDLDKGALYGYTSMILAFSLIYVGVRNFRNKYNGGVVSFGKAFRIGLYITLIASTIYVGVWLVAYFFYVHDFGKVYAEHAIAKLQAAGAGADAIAKKRMEMDNFTRVYDNPFYNMLLTYSEIFPVGLIVSLITAFVLKRKKI